MQAMTWFPPGARDLVTQLLETRPEDRPTAGQCLRHPWLQRPRDAKSLKVWPRTPFSSCTLENLGETTSRRLLSGGRSAGAGCAGGRWGPSVSKQNTAPNPNSIMNRLRRLHVGGFV
ncbi:unnamed protein product [Prorocentrum cordatum]|uniref:Non-specific serine/threonine protein kinase n=1 Tax=Prorocentrum cordatum TaxID=2364126 RepID=A0ABN9QWK2_9DINO|nr:unnamed protein product [Polarella glacialis]